MFPTVLPGGFFLCYEAWDDGGGEKFDVEGGFRDGLECVVVEGYGGLDTRFLRLKLRRIAPKVVGSACRRPLDTRSKL